MRGGEWPSHSGIQPGEPRQQYSHTLEYGSSSMPKGKGAKVVGTYKPPSTSNNLHYETIDSTFYVRNRPFFYEGRVFAVMMNETAGENSNVSPSGHDATDYNSSGFINPVKYKGNVIYKNVRKFIVVRRKQEFCYACPIFTYSKRGTTKRGVRPSEHGIAYTWNQTPQLLQGEGGITKAPIAVVMAAGVQNLHVASRVYYGIIHPIRYNVKAKEIGYVPKQDVPKLIGNWKSEDEKDTYQNFGITESAEFSEEPEDGEDDDDDEDYDEDEDADDDDDDDHDDDDVKGTNSKGHSFLKSLSNPRAAGEGFSLNSLQSNTAPRERPLASSIHKGSMSTLQRDRAIIHHERPNISIDTVQPRDTTSTAGILGSPRDKQLPESEHSHDSDVKSGENLSKDTEHVDTDEDDDHISMFQLFRTARLHFENATTKGTGWAWHQDCMVAKRVSDSSCRLNNWYESIYWLASNSPSSAIDAISEKDKDDKIEALFKLISLQHPFLSSNVSSYLDDISHHLDTIKNSVEHEAMDNEYILRRYS